MANHCYNWIMFSGDPYTLKEIKNKMKLYDEYDYVAEWGNFITGNKHDHYESYGGRWFEFSIDDDEGDLVIQGDSAWTPMIGLVMEICEAYAVKGIIEYEESGNDFGGMISFDTDGGQIEEVNMPYGEWRYHNDPEEYFQYDILEYVGDYEDYDEMVGEYKFLSDKHKQELKHEFTRQIS